MAGLALGDMELRFVWQAWHLVTSTFTSGLGLVTRLVAASFCLAGVAKAWHLTTSTFTLCGRRGTYGTQLGRVTRLVAFGAASFCMAGLALGDMATSTFTLCGRRVRLRHSAGSCDALGRVWRRLILHGRCGKGVALGDIDLHFVWQAWHLRQSAGSCDALGRVWRRLILHGRRGTRSHGALFCVAGVALGDIDLHFVLPGTYGTQLGRVTRLVAFGAASFCVAGVALTLLSWVV
eukprot:s785_g17.t1